ncbi:MAG TPA: right-handed parallel beta-helix repeat-containing protein [Phycisphaerae bacterium]|nr:right-handed parallel beta-helix repeat-containing protein [Phycisphaerales bacterium]HRX86399.1 right-handed parallel beta-helix repeat-containing protein [Phycisphaerae bacterium]
MKNRWKCEALALLCAVTGAARADGTAAAKLFSMREHDAAPALRADEQAPGVKRRGYVAVNADALDRVAPGSVCRVTAALFADATFVLTIERSSARLSAWTGCVDGIAGSDVVLVERDGGVTGVIRAGARGVFEIRDLGADVHEVRQLDVQRLRGCRRPPSVAHVAAAVRGAGSGFCDDGSVVDLLVVYTADARVAAGGVAAIEGLIDLAVADANAALARSEVQTAIRLVHAQEVTYAETGQADMDGPRLVATDDGFLDEVHELRDAYGADCVSLWVNALDTGGIGYFPDATLTGIGASGFSELRLDNAALGTLAHELGHNFYCTHDRLHTADVPWADYAYGYVEPGGAWQTIMATAATAYIPYFANPDVAWPGPTPPDPGPTGVAEGQPEPADTARAINETAIYVANFRPTAVSGLSNVLYVAADATPGGDGESWASAVNDLQVALCRAAGSGGVVTQIWVKAGTYRPDSGGQRTGTFHLADGLAIYGGFAGTEVSLSERRPAQHSSILSGDIGVPGDASDNCYHVVTADIASATAVLDGFTITEGNANGADPDDRGAGILVRGAGAARIANCTVTGNTATYGGAGLYCDGTADPQLTDCTFTANIVTGTDWPASGGGLQCQGAASPLLERCVFSANGARYGAGIASLFGASPELRHCVIENHAPGAGSEGAGLYAYSNCNVTLTYCVLRANAADYGGAMANWFNSSATLTGCRLMGNSGGVDGGGLYNYSDCAVALVNCLAAGNSTAESGGACASLFNSDLQVINTTVVGNVAGFDGGGLSFYQCAPLLASSILWANTVGGVVSEHAQVVSDGAVAIDHCTVQAWSGTLGGSGNSGADPTFRDADGGDNTYGTADDDARLAAGSPCIDTGVDALPTGVVEDLDGRPRVVGGTIDRGAYEFPPALPGDFDGDGDSDLIDYAALADCMAGPDAPPAPTATIAATCLAVFDADADGDVDLRDAAALVRDIGGN